METIYGIQADTETLREAHERQRRTQQLQLQQRLQEQQSSVVAEAAEAKSGVTPLRGPPKPTVVARSTSTSSLPTPITLGGGRDVAGHGNKSADASGTATPTNLAMMETPSGAVGGQSGSSALTSTSGSSQASSTFKSGSTATSPFFSPADHTGAGIGTAAGASGGSGPAQLRSTTHSPAFLSKFYDMENHHRLQGAIPWLSLPGAVTTPTAAVESPGGGGGGHSQRGGLFGRRRSDGGGIQSSSSSGTSTPVLTGFDKLSLMDSSLSSSPSSILSSPPYQQENPYPHPPQPQPHHPHHHHHLLSRQELAAFSRNNSPMPLNEALPSYLRKKNADSLQSMERSFSNPGTMGAGGNALSATTTLTTAAAATTTGMIHTAPGSPFMMPIHPPPASLSSPSHLLFPFPGSSSTTGSSLPPATSTYTKPEMERANSTGVLPMNRPHAHLHHHHHHHHSHLGTTIGGSTTAASGTTGAGAGIGTGSSTPSSFFRLRDGNKD
ncbi:hypothetical protein EDD11_002817 [Mortierella claussenii]|nr:hypothetical protein EDD11_002817 [Mortierella claussenii]